ncbi:MAG: hypothetical protein HQL84_12310 [Magnetococcales bacterium]|nr:hypothetical protein [Magnetococcales bacterium]MBF0150817.1 hypothetical protein [Magnetococcales bacterium]MBF0172339.1 hypothetical protein [Magnetococcales bacterium]
MTEDCPQGFDLAQQVDGRNDGIGDVVMARMEMNLKGIGPAGELERIGYAA